MRLVEFIQTNMEPIIDEWENFARTLTPAANTMGRSALRDHAGEILQFITADISTAQTEQEQFDKSRGETPGEITKNSAAEIHGALRSESGFSIIEMVSEYRALRASVTKLWTKERGQLDAVDLLDLTRFHEAIDQALAESVRRFTESLEGARDLFLGILGHDLRSPLGAVSMSAKLIPMLGELNEKQKALATQIFQSASRAADIVHDLLELTRARTGTGMTIEPEPMDMEILCQELVNEMIAFQPDRKIVLATAGDLTGQWDKIRIGQVLSNLISNALQYSAVGSTVNVSVEGGTDSVILAVHNLGAPISPSMIGKIFNPLIRGQSHQKASESPSTSLGLGLYISKQIIASHDGEITVNSSEMEGTTFTVHLPKITQIAEKSVQKQS